MDNQKNRNEVDPEMLENLDLLMNLDVVEKESEWQDIEEMDEVGEEVSDEELFDEA